ncbi:MAG: cyclase family protein [Thermoleophilia bacterium]
MDRKMIIDISVPIFSGMAFYPGDPGAEIKPHLQISGGAVANISELKMGSHTGTHIDAPQHFKDGALTVDEIPLEALVGPARVVDMTAAESLISIEEIENAGLKGVSRLLIKTSNSALWGLADFQKEYVSLSREAAAYLVDIGVRLVGIDYLSIERFKSDSHAVHHSLLGSGVIVLEGVDLSNVASGDYELICLPLKIRGGDGAPARAVLIT